MSNQDNSNGSDELRPQVVVMEKPQHSDAGVAEPLAPRLIATAQTGRIVPVPPVEPPPAAAAPGGRQRYSLTMKLGLAGLIAASRASFRMVVFAASLPFMTKFHCSISVFRRRVSPRSAAISCG